MIQSIRPGPASGPLLLADISGYTGFLQAVAAAHRDDAFADGRVPDAYGLVSSLLDGMLKSHAAELIGHPAYALITEAAASRLAVPAGGAREFTETYEHYSPIAARVYALR